MDPMESEHVAEFLSSLEEWTDHRFVSREVIRDLAMYSVYLVNLLEHADVQYYGHSYKVGKPMGCLVVKADIDGIPHVVFTSGRTYTACIRAFLRKLSEGWLEWRVDKFRG